MDEDYEDFEDVDENAPTCPNCGAYITDENEPMPMWTCQKCNEGAKEVMKRGLLWFLFH